MLVAEAEGTFKEMLRAAGLDPSFPDFRGAWDVFKAFMRVLAEDAPWTEGFRDGMIFEWGAYDWQDGKGERFEVDFVRQFSLYVDGEYDHMEQLHCNFYFAPTDLRRNLGSGDVWGDPETRESLAKWVRDVEAQPAFVAAASEKPDATLIQQEEI
jgi:hypothetical protein